MKKAQFKFTGTPNKPTILWGSVTQKNDGKITISFHNPRMFSSATRFQAKQLANEIVKAEFKHTAVTHFVETKDNSSIVVILKRETASLKVQYLTLTEKFAKKSFKMMDEKTTWKTEQWYDHFGITYTFKEVMGRKQAEVNPKEYNGKKLYKMRNESDRCWRIVEAGFEKYLAKELKFAEQHYEDSILKLADRIEAKNLNQDNLTVKTSHIGVNINTTLTDGTQTVKAWTIIASGEIQRPHYRYLIK